MEDKLHEFIFEDLVSKPDYSPHIEALEKKKENAFFNRTKASLMERIDLLKQEKENTESWYESLSEIFSEIRNQQKHNMRAFV